MQKLIINNKHARMSGVTVDTENATMWKFSDPCEFCLSINEKVDHTPGSSCIVLMW